MVYPDTSFLASLYAPDKNGRQAFRLYQSRGAPPMICTPFQRLELFSVLLRQRELGELDPHKCFLTFREIEYGFRSGTLLHLTFHAVKTFRISHKLAEQHGKFLESRANDLMHVGSALVLQARHFWSFDDRQCKLAKAAGLTVN